MADYISANELRAYIGSDTNNYTETVDLVCTTASRLIEKACDKPYEGFLPASSASARRYFADEWLCVKVDDFYTTTGLIVQTDDDANGSYETTWTITTDFILEPDVSDRPYNELVAVGSRWFIPRQYSYGRRSVQVTAKWGWSAVPEPVKDATLMLAAQLFKLKDAPDGFVGLDGWGPTRVTENKLIRSVLGPYMANPIAVA